MPVAAPLLPSLTDRRVGDREFTVLADFVLVEHPAAIHADLGAPVERAALDAFARLAEKAAQYGDVDTEVRALLGSAHAASWHDREHYTTVLASARVERSASRFHGSR
jgi:hypothetical protein